MIWLVQDAHQRGFRSGYTECRLIKKWVYAVYLRIPSTTPLIIPFEKVIDIVVYTGNMFAQQKHVSA